MKKEERIVYVDGTDFIYHLDESGEGGGDIYGVRVYNAPEDLKDERRCWKGCGIIRARLVFEEWAEKPDERQFDTGEAPGRHE